MLKTYRIIEAQDGGYIIIEDRGDEWTNRPLFAGSLIGALEYLGKKFEGDAA